MTSRRATRRAQTHIPYDTPAAADRWWDRLTPDERSAAVDADPLRFLADHLLMSDRCEGSLALYGDFGPGTPALPLVLHDAPTDPTVDECGMTVWRFAEALGHLRDEAGADHVRLGMIHHRTGPSSVTDLDRRWLIALDALAPRLGYEVLGVLARTERGALVEATDAD